MRLTEIESINWIKKNRTMFADLYYNWKATSKCKLSPKPKIVGTIGRFQIQDLPQFGNKGKTVTVGLYDSIKNRFSMFVSLSSEKANKCFKVETVGVDLPYQGWNLPVQLYSWLILKQNIVLVSGDAQSPGGRSIWEKLAQTPGIFMFGYDTYRKRAFQIDQNDIFNEDIYDADLLKEYEELQKEYNSLEYTYENMSSNNPEEHELSKKLDKLQAKINSVYKAQNDARHIVLVAIKSHGKTKT